jgi:hypothetical protein
MKKVLWLGTLISLSSVAQTPVKTFEDLWSQFHQSSLSRLSLEEE